ncbi:GntR family transcriptional regulator [Effusibacillus consociatus]|uniref:GntR family transcriptional regulator n=1 Tax=Effusibacillus consociatus TaxID=1117041 RepID=A0ABV9PZ32_9BACL
MNIYSVEKPMPYYDQLYNSIKQMIIEGVFQPGERIYEAQLAREFNVSRSPVREAVRALEKEGLLIIDEKSRITVYKPTMKDVEDIYQCRMVLESLAAKLTTTLATNQELSEIESTLSETRKLLEQGEEPNKETIISLNSRFHDLIVQYSRNSRLQKQLQDLRSLTYYYMLINIQGENRKWDIFNEHQVIFDCMKQRDAEKAGSVMANHISNDLNHLKELLK